MSSNVQETEFYFSQLYSDARFSTGKGDDWINPLFTKKINIFFSHKNGNVSPTKVRNLSKSR